MNGSEFGFDSGKREMRVKRTYQFVEVGAAGVLHGDACLLLERLVTARFECSVLLLRER